MGRRLTAIKSEINQRMLKKKIKVERSKTPSRFSRRLRHMEPECKINRENIKSNIKENKSTLTIQSHFIFKTGHKKHYFRKLKYPQSLKDSKEVISILSAPKFIHHKKHHNLKQTHKSEFIRPTSCKPKLMKNKNCTCHRYHRYFSSKCCTPKKGNMSSTQLIENRKKYVLDVLNRGDVKDIEKLHSVGSKTAEKIILYRQIKGTINKLSELSKIPQFPKQQFDNFMVQNFLKVE
ncbi:uncharacterized protein LOC143198741 isoform X2 [Rhynchophorus ferrugineus]|uniref:uncharacterized protein LOC143198741 isoform X2 n=1 Tax=Rhynchophorus ferrugineus TaxID=354439 RepID=UPI003FCDCE84